MTRGNARELAVHLIYGRVFTGEEPETVVSVRLDKEYYAQLSGENDVYTERPSRAQLRYIDNVVTGVANREEELNAQIAPYCQLSGIDNGIWRRESAHWTSYGKWK